LGGAAGAVRVELERGGGVILVPRMSHGVLRFEGRADAGPAPEPAQGHVAGTALLSLDRDGRLVGAEILEEQRWWRPEAVAWDLRTRAHALRVLEHDPAQAPEPRWDAVRRLFWLAWSDAPAPRVVGLGPRAHAAVDGDRLVALLADLRGFGR